MANGVPSDAILLETQAANTYENVDAVEADPRQPRLAQRARRQLAVPHAARDVDLAQERAGDRRRFRRRCPRVSSISASGGPSIDQMRGLLQEYAAIALYWWRDWI